MGFFPADTMTPLQKISARLERLPDWALPCFIAGAVISVSLIFLWPAYREFPMDDAYIHLMYAQNLAESGRLYFSVPEEVGVASSSLLWVLLLAAGYKISLSMHVLAKILGVASLAVTGVSVYRLLTPVWPRWKSLTAALLICLSGNMLWFSLNGMETTLFLALGLIALRLYRAGRWGWLGLALGLLILTRPEGLFLAAALGLMDIVAHRRLARGLILAAVIALLICAPWFIYLHWRTGDFLPTSAGGKQFGIFTTISYMVDRYHLPGILRQIPGLLYPFMWIVYLLEFALGGISLPPPKLTYGGSNGNPAVDLSLWALPAMMLVIWLIVQSGKRFFSVRRWRDWIQSPQRRVFLILVAWVILHNLAYMFFLPLPGTASRYGALNYIPLWVAILAGLSSFTARPRLQIAAAISILLIGLCNTFYWNTVYDANIEHMLNVRIAAADYMRDEMPNDRCAAFDIGALRYFGGRPIVEIAALIDTEANQWVTNGKVDEYLMNHEVTCLILPGRAGHSTDGIYDLAEMLKLDSSPLFDLELVRVFEIDHERWLLGYLPTANYQASVAFYRLKYK